MMLSLLFFALFVAGSFANVINEQEYGYAAFVDGCGNCGSSSDPLYLSQCSITPAQLSFPGTFSFALDGVLSETLTPPIKLDVTIQKQIGVWITVPCINETLGSCTFEDLCQLKYLSAFCPVNPGEINNTLTIPLPAIDIPDAVAGNYKLKALVSHEGGEIGCIYINLSIAKTSEKLI